MIQIMRVSNCAQTGTGLSWTSVDVEVHSCFYNQNRIPGLTIEMPDYLIGSINELFGVKL